MSQTVLITGCSTGIGRDLAGQLTRAGYQVVATARHVQALNDVPAALKLPLDVTQPESVHQAVEKTLECFGRIDVLVNNAGYAVRGAVEEISDAQVQAMFDANVFGAMRMIRAVAPQMRKQKAGRIINISSIAGKRSTPANGTYSASKFALEALSDALRLELAPFGIQVVLIEPGSIKTHFVATADAHAQAIVSNPASPYQTLYQQSDQFAAGMRQNAPGPEAVSQAIQQAIETAQPKARYLVAIPFSGRLVLHLGDSIWDYALRRMFKFTPADRVS
jgi:NAD(P)-dependent dehydrogenase (short-subunit alcohol dehydrogenase family)